MTPPDSEPERYPAAHADAVWMPGDIGEGDYFRRSGYLAGARMLINACDNATGRHLLLPALNCYRQYFELQLKELARAGRAIRAEDGRDRRSHALDVADIQATLIHIALVEDRSAQQAKAHARHDLADLRTAIATLNELDPAGVAFRYAYHVSDDGQRTPTVAEGFFLDLPAAIAALEAGAVIAEGADTYLDVWRDNYSDYLAEMSAIEAELALDYAYMFSEDPADSSAEWNRPVDRFLKVVSAGGHDEPRGEQTQAAASRPS